jgi:hypothetical protein
LIKGGLPAYPSVSITLQQRRRKDGRLLAAFQHFPKDDERNFDRVAVAFSKDEGVSWSKPERFLVDGMEAGLARPFDPTLVPLPDWRLRMYFTSNRSPDFRRSTPEIYSAISDDGVRYQFEPGVRFSKACTPLVLTFNLSVASIFLSSFRTSEQRTMPAVGAMTERLMRQKD